MIGWLSFGGKCGSESCFLRFGLLYFLGFFLFAPGFGIFLGDGSADGMKGSGRELTMIASLSMGRIICMTIAGLIP